MTKTVQDKLEVWERKILRRIFGGRKVDDIWVRRTNEDIYKLFDEAPVGQVVKARRLQWLGHLQRMEDERLIKNIGRKAPDGKRKRGRPRKKWMDAVLEDLKEKRIENWELMARDRKQWKLVTKLWA